MDDESVRSISKAFALTSRVPVVVKSSSPLPAPRAIPTASIVAAPVTSTSSTPASICTSESASALASIWKARPAVCADTSAICPSAEVVVTTISSAASTVIASAESMSTLPALAFKCNAEAPVPADASRSSWVPPPATAMSRSLADPVTVRFESSVPSIDTVVPSIVMPAVTSTSNTPASI